LARFARRDRYAGHNEAHIMERAAQRSRSEQERIALLQGTLDLLILRTLRLGPAHGHAIVKAIESGSNDVLLVEQGSLYPALHRLIARGWITFDEGTSENNRRAKFYRLTAKGRKQLDIETGRWDKLAGAIARILRPATQG
jgi:PadR family transcriptional regulator PadR